MPRRRGKGRLVTAAALVVVLALAGGCGVSTSAPVDQGDKIPAVPPFGDRVLPVPHPNTARSEEALVREFLKAPVGGGDTATAQVKEFLTARARTDWRDPVNPQNPQLTVVRILSGPTPGLQVGGRTPVTVQYQIVGVLNDQGRVGELSQPATGSMTFWVVPDEENPVNRRIDQIDNPPSGLLLSDEALNEIYRIQPVYFWDADYKLLVPDLRYLPLTLGEEQRANRLVQWLLTQPSSWLTGVQPLTGTPSLDRVVIRGDETFVVNLRSEAAPTDTALLYYQLQWTLSNGSNVRKIELQLNGQPQPVSSDGAFRDFNRAWEYRDPRPRYDIVDQRAAPLSGAEPPILTGPENQDVVSAAINRDGTVAALVRRTADGRRQLQVVRDGAESVASVSRADMSRPSWVPGPDAADEFVMLASGGHIYLVSTVDATFTRVTPSRLEGVSAVTVSPDGRRVALVADGVAYVASLTVEGDSLTLGSNPRAILTGQVAASGVAWLSETWLYVGGTAIGQGTPAIWRVTADGVVARDESANLRGAPVAEIVVAPVWPADQPADVYIYTPNQGVYAFGTVATETGLSAPFFGG